MQKEQFYLFSMYVGVYSRCADLSLPASVIVIKSTISYNRLVYVRDWSLFTRSNIVKTNGLWPHPKAVCFVYLIIAVVLLFSFIAPGFDPNKLRFQILRNVVACSSLSSLFLFGAESVYRVRVCRSIVSVHRFSIRMTSATCGFIRRHIKSGYFNRSFHALNWP